MTLEEQPPLETAEERATEQAVTEEVPVEPTDVSPAEPTDASPVEPTDAELHATAAEAQDDTELDDAIAQLDGEPEPTQAPVVSDEVAQAVEESRHDSVSAWPFVVYVAVWVLFSAFVVWRFIETPADTALYEVPLYRWIVFGGVALTIAGPVLALGVWLAAIRHPDAERGALFASALFKGAIATFAGVCVWWASLLVLDQIRIGSLL